MTKAGAVARGGLRTVALVLGKTGLHASVNGGESKPLPFSGSLNAATLVQALRGMFVTDDQPRVRIVLVGTRSDNTPGWDAIDPRELETYASDSLEFVIVSEAEALHKGFLTLQGDDHFLIFQAPAGVFRHQAEVLNQPRSTPHQSAYLVFATARNGAAATPTAHNVVGSVRCWVEGGGGVKPADVIYMGNNFGSIYTMSGGSIVTTTSMVASLVEALIEHYPQVTRVFVWSQDGLQKYSDYRQDGAFWRYVRLPQKFIDAAGEIIAVKTALSLVRLASGAFADTPTVKNKKES